VTYREKGAWDFPVGTVLVKHFPHASLDHRVRSCLEANCSHCHHPDGVTANFNASFDTALY